MNTHKILKRLALLSLLLFPFSAVFTQVVVKMKKDGGVSVIPCKVNGLNLKFIFDTGASDVSISMTEASFMLKNDYLSKDDILGKSNYLDANGNISEGVNIILREIEIGGMKLFNIRASVVTNLKAPLLLGQSAISKLGVVQLDLEANTLTILNPKDSVINTIAVHESPDTVKVNSTSINQEYIITDSLLTEAETNFENQNYLETIRNCDLVFDVDQDNKKAYFYRALSYDMLQDYKSAIRDYDKLIKLVPNNHVYYCYRGKSKFDLLDYTGAVVDLNKGLLINDKYVRGYLWRSQAKEKLKNTPSAILDIDKAISLEPLDSSLYIERAFLKQGVNDYKGAVVDCNKAININPQYARAYYCRGLAKEYLKDYSDAINDYNQAIDLNSEMAGPYAARGNIKENQYEDFDAALEDYNKALELNPDYVYASILKSALEEKIKKNVWLKVGSSTQGNKWYIYNTTISKEDNIIKIWAKSEVKTFTTRKYGKSVSYNNVEALMLCLFNCGEKEYKILSIKNYDSKGNLINEDNRGEYTDWEAAAPGTVIDKVLEQVCERYN